MTREKLYGWVVVQILNLDSKNIEFYIKESEMKGGIPKFPELLQKSITYRRKKKIWQASMARDEQYSVHFKSTGCEFIPEQGREYVLLINTTPYSQMEIWKAGTKAEFCKVLGRPYSEPFSTIIEDERVYLVNILLIQGSVKGTLSEICRKLQKSYGSSEAYLTHRDTDWYIVSPDGTRTETTQPRLPENVR